MKKTYFAFAVLSMAALLVSCQENEFNENAYIPEKGDIVFRLANGSKDTKSSDATVKGVTMDLGTIDGTNLFLEETVTRLDQVTYGPETKGTPAYTENFTDLYGDFKAAAFKSSGGTFETSAFDDGVFEKVSGSEIDIWKRKYGDLDENLPLFFFLRAPYDNESTTAGVGKVSGLTYSTSDGSISFSYTSPATATAQEDLLFTSRKVESAEYEALQDKSTGIPVLFHHALTGVKFAIANPDGGYNDGKTHSITITKVEFSGLVNSGSCVITPRKENGGYEDVIGDHSSGGTNKTTVWTLGTGTGTFSQEFTTTDFISYEQGTGKSFANNGEYPESFAAAGNENNLNDGDATKTFWFIPQTMTANVKLTVTFTIDGVAQTPVPIDFGSILGNVTWEAGELRTYTLHIDDVNVKIEDTVDLKKTTITDGENSYDDYKGSTKADVVITNTGNTDAFIRAAIVGQWLDRNGDPVFGFTDELLNLKLVESWYEDQFVYGNHIHGEFKGLVGYDEEYTGDWVKGDDGYYYYTKVVKAGESIPEDDPLFTSYTVGELPDSELAGVPNHDLYFVLEVANQAISAKKVDGSYYTMAEAWARTDADE